MDIKQAAKFRTGWIVGGILAVLTLVEYFVAIGMQNNLAPLAIIGVAKAWLILKYFMHISQIWDEGEDH